MGALLHWGFRVDDLWLGGRSHWRNWKAGFFSSGAFGSDDFGVLDRFDLLNLFGLFTLLDPVIDEATIVPSLPKPHPGQLFQIEQLIMRIGLNPQYLNIDRPCHQRYFGHEVIDIDPSCSI